MKSRGTSLQYACFACRKSFKRPQSRVSTDRFMTSEQAAGQDRELGRFNDTRQYRCPDCGGQAWYMGIDFKAPKRADEKAWQTVEAFIRSGQVYYRGSRN